MRFEIEQVALCPRDPGRAIELLTAMGASDWVIDHVTAKGAVFNADVELENQATLQFNYDMLKQAKELEVLHYQFGVNWMQAYVPRVSHFGMHCSEEELSEWKDFFAARGIKIIQEVRTQRHTNAAIAGKRWYHYCIFDTYAILSVDIKFIVRIEPGTV